MSNDAPVSRSGRFERGPESEVAEFTESVSFDRRLWRQDIRGSIAHARMLEAVGLLAREELDAIVQGLEAIGREIEAGSFQWKTELEDVHMNIEAELTRRTPAGAKLHTGRSRNDQIAVDMRLWLREEIDAWTEELRDLQRSLVEWADAEQSVVIPGYTHLQRAQPVLASHHLLAYVEMIDRDRQRAEECRRRLNVCPLGSGALAGSSLPLDREFVARELGFVDDEGRARVTQNSMDAVSDRDFVVEICAVVALAAVHFSRMAEDLVLWASAEFGFIRIEDAFTTGSSLMPQKKNPDLAELARGKTGRAVGNLMSVLTLLKGLPMTYNRDLQEDKERLFDSVDTARATTRILSAMARHTRFVPEACAWGASDPGLLATEAADYLVRKGAPFRRAHHAVGAAVALAERLGKPLDGLTLPELKSVDSSFAEDISGVFELNQALEHRRATGAPSPRGVSEQLERWRAELNAPEG